MGGSCLRCIDEYDGWPTLKAALQFTALTFPRSTELRLMRRNEIIWPKATWQIPAERMKPHGKLRVPHDVPLSRQALAALRSVWDFSEGDGLVFPSVRSSKKPLSENALNSALRRMGYSKEEHTAHGFRTSASTILNERFPAMGEVIEVRLLTSKKTKFAGRTTGPNTGRNSNSSIRTGPIYSTSSSTTNK